LFGMSQKHVPYYMLFLSENASLICVLAALTSPPAACEAN